MSNLKMPSAELRDIERLVRDIARTGPVVSLYLGLDDRADPNRILLRWRQQRTLLEQRGARPEDLHALEEEVASATYHPGSRALAAFATEGRAHLSWLLERASIEDSSTGPTTTWRFAGSRGATTRSRPTSRAAGRRSP